MHALPVSAGRSSPPVHTDRVGVEGVGADEGDGVLQVVVLDSILIVLIGDHSQSQGSHRVLAPVGQFHFQGHSVAHFTVGHDVTVARLPVHQHIWRKGDEERISRTLNPTFKSGARSVLY